MPDREIRTVHAPGAARAGAVQFRVLGAVEGVRGGGAVHFRGGMTRQLLAILLAHPNQPIANDQLAELLWSGRPPRSWASALRVHVTHLRTALESDDGATGPPPARCLETVRGGYELMVGDHQVDSMRFERMLREAFGHGDDAARVVVELELALGLWRGPAFADVRGLPCLEPEVTRLEELRAATLERFFDARLVLGEHRDVVGGVEVALVDHPLRERFTEQLVLALYRSGRQADALRACSRLRTRLTTDLGIEPNLNLQELERQVLEHDARLDWVEGAQWERAAMPAPRPLRSAGALVGRAVELDRFRDVLVSAGRGIRSSLLVSGPPGIGKTRLVQALAEVAADFDAATIRAHCEADPSYEFQPVCDALGELLRLSPGLFPDADEPTAGELALLVPALGAGGSGRAVGKQPTPGRHRLFEAVAMLLDRASARGPIVLVLDDLHLADHPTGLMVRHLLRHPDTRKVVLVATCRDDEVRSGHPVLDVLLRPSGDDVVERIALTGLSPVAVARLIELVEPEELRERVARLAFDITRQTKGNPLFIEELVEHLRHMSPESVDLEAVERAAPEGLRGLVAERVNRLPDGVREILEVAAVIGTSFSVPVLASVAESDPAVVIDSLEAAARAGIVDEDSTAFDHFSFSHPVVRNAIYGELTRSRRVRLHHRVGEVLEAVVAAGTPGRAAELAHHFGEAATASWDVEKAISFARAAGDEAMHGLAFETAAAHYRQALGLLDAGSDADVIRARLLLLLGQAYEASGRRAEARSQFLAAAEIAARCVQPTLLAEASLSFARPWPTIADLGTPVADLLDDALDAIGPAPTVHRARLLACKAASLQYVDGTREVQERLAADALETARQVGDPGALCDALLTCRHPLGADPADVDLRLALAREATETADDAGLVSEQLDARAVLLGDLLVAGKLDEFALELGTYQDLARRAQEPAELWWGGVLGTTQAAMEGRLEEALKLEEYAHRLGTRLEQPDAFGIHFVQALVLGQQCGTLERFPYRYAPLAPEDPSVVPGIQSSLNAFHAAHTGRDDAARRALDILAIDDFAAARAGRFTLANLAFAAEAAALVDARDHGEALAELLEPYADLVGVSGAGIFVLGSLHRHAGVLAATCRRPVDAAEHLEEAIAVNDRLGMPYWAQQARLDLAAIQRTVHADAAASLCEDVRTAAESFGWTSMERKARALAVTIHS